jgi:triacylglycerol lipase
MNPVLVIRRARQRLRELRSYLELNFLGNRVERRTDFTRCQRPVLLLYGFFATRRTLEVLERRLRRDGYCVFSVNLGGLGQVFNTRGIADVADFLRSKVERMYARHAGMGPLTIVGHSKGGLIGAYYVKRLGGHRRVRALVTLGTPYNGTLAALLGLPILPLARSVLQMMPGSAFVRRLRTGPWPENVHLASLYSRRDRVAPYPTAILRGRGQPNVRNVEVDCDHGGFLVKKRAYEALLREIRLAETTAGAELRLVPGKAS